MWSEIVDEIKRLKQLVRAAEEDVGDMIEDVIASPQDVDARRYKLIFLTAELAYQRVLFKLECDKIWKHTPKEEAWIRELCPDGHSFCWRCI